MLNKCLLKNKTAVITGSNRGIGKKILEIFSENGANIFACSRNLDNNFKTHINELEKKYDNKIIPVKLDLKDQNSIKECSNLILKSDKSVDILINNAGAIHTALFQMTSRKKLEEIFEVNYFSQFDFTQNIIKSMIKKKTGSIIYISSSAATDGNTGRSAYASSKAALNSQAKVLSNELGSYNIRVNIIAPGLTNTDMMLENTPKNIIEETLTSTSLKKSRRNKRGCKYCFIPIV